MKQYVHPMNGMASHGFKTDFAEGYKISNGKGLLVFGDEWISEMVLLEFGFIEKEEEPDTDTKWIEDVHSEYLEAIVSNSLYVGDDRFTDDERLAVLKKAILSNLPKQWKTQATPEK